MKHSSGKGALCAALSVGLLASPIAAMPAYAAPAGVVINEAYVNGGSANAPYLNKFVELHNTTDQPVDISGWSLQYRSSGSSGAPSGISALSGSIPANGHYLIGGTSNAANGVELPPTDATTNASFAAGGGTLILSNEAEALDPLAIGSVTDNPAVVDLLGYGSSNTFESAAAEGPGGTTNPLSMNRTDFADTDNNANDFTLLEDVTPTNANGDTGSFEPEPDPEPPVAGEVVPIAKIQGTSDVSPLEGDTVTTRGVVTADYPAGGFDGYVIQTAGTGGDPYPENRTASDGIFIYSPGTVDLVDIGDHVEVTGVVDEFFDVTQIEVVAGAATVLPDDGAEVTSLSTPWPATEEEREVLENMLIRPTGDFTVSDNYDLNRFGEINLAAGPNALVQPTEIGAPGSPENLAVQASNAALGVTLDDGASVDYLASMNQTLPYLTAEDPVRVNDTATFTSDVIVDFGFDAWRFQPVTHLTGDNAAEVQPVEFAGERPALPMDVGGDIKIASFNVLNYFSTTGDQLTGCNYFNDREGNPITVRGGCDARGAANAVNFERQEAKIVEALNNMDADMVSLEEIENSAAFGADRDEALETLTAALNEDAPGVWDFVPSPADIPENEDVIRNAFIYKTAAVETVGKSVILDDDVAFSNARKPLAQAFQAAGGDESTKFLAIVNHFKSKGSGEGENADQGDGQGASNADRVEQATALVAFAETLKDEAGTERVFLTGDFNAYSAEDPMQVFYDAGYINQGPKTGKYSYIFGGQAGSLDHILTSPAAEAMVTGTDIWNINAVESVALEYSRFNYTPVNYYTPDQYRSSDHDPVIVGLDFGAEVPDPGTTEINLLNINDFHGRIDRNTVKFAGTVEQLRAAAGDDNSLFISAGDNIGASLFASSSQRDVPTIDVLNALDLAASAVGNHEFDGGFADLTDRVDPIADFTHLGANVYADGTTDPAMEEFEVFTIDGIDVAVIGAVTVETPTLVSPGGIADLDFGDPVEAVNRVAQEIEDGGLADVIIAEYHEGAAGSSEDSAALPEIEPGSAFESIVNETTPLVDAIFNGHTHSFYASDAPVPGEVGQTRPIVQTGSYGEFIGQIELTVDNTSGEVIDYEARNVPRTEIADEELVADYPRVAEVQAIVDEALETADELGSVVLGKVTEDITTAFIGDERDDRGSESTLGNLVADSLLSSLEPDERGGAEIGVANPGGLRSELYFGENGDITVAEANAVLPFLNNLWTTTLTGEQFTSLLEQQWPREDGLRTSFLNLGLSDNVTYTYDPELAEGSRITSVTIDGAPLDPARDYRIGTFNFLAQGGDDFVAFNEGIDTLDSGLVDREAWFDYIEDDSPLSPSFDRRGVVVQDAPETVVPGEEVAFTVSKLDLTSLGSPTNTSVVLSYTIGDGEPVDIDTFDVTDGAAAIAFTVPADAQGATFRLNAPDSGTMVRLPIGVELVGFTDIEGNEHQHHIEWMAENGLSTGWLEDDGTRTYRPLSSINRDAMAAFLYRLAGEPEFELPEESPFADVAFPADAADRVEHLDAIMWMHVSGLSTGWPEADGTFTFRPVTPVNRDAMAAFMKRFAGEICLDQDTLDYLAPGTAPFSDIAVSNLFHEEISWMKETGITEGWGDNTYRPVTPVARDAMAAFVNRFDDGFGTCGR